MLFWSHDLLHKQQVDFGSCAVMNGSIYIILIIRDIVYCTVLRNRGFLGGFHGFLHSSVIKCDGSSPLT